LQLFWTPPGGSEEISEPVYVTRPPESEEGSGPSQGTGPAQVEPPVDTGPSASGCAWCPEDLTGLDLTRTWSCDDGEIYCIT